MLLPLCLIVINLLPSVRFSDGINKVTTPGNESTLNYEAYMIYYKLKPDQLSLDAFQLAYQGYQKLRDSQLLENDSVLTVIDYSLPSDKERLWIIDVKNCNILEKSLVAHGRASGELYAVSFSDTPQSHMSCLGFFITGQTYNGKHGYSLTIEGVEDGINSNAKKRSIVFHGAAYVSSDYIQKAGRLGRSFGCPALPVEQNQKIIDLIKGESCVFIYSEDKTYLTTSKLISSSQISQIIH